MLSIAMKLKTYIAIVILGPIVAMVLFGFTSRHASNPQQEQIQFYRNAAFDLTFAYPADWRIEERYGRRSMDPRSMSPKGAVPPPPQVGTSVENVEDSGVMRLQIILRRPSGESMAVTIFPKPSSLERWIQAVDPRVFQESRLSLGQPNAVVDGRQAYRWSTMEAGQEGTVLAFSGDSYLYQVGFWTGGPGDQEIENLLDTISTTGDDARALGTPSSLFFGTRPLASTCCDTDTYNNSYPCCSPGTGNCTWKSEQARVGNDNFIFGGPGTGRDAYRWMSLAKQYTERSYAQGGTIPRIDAVLVLIDDFGGTGHVATVTSVGDNGSVTVTEQNCDLTCTRTKTYTTTQLRRYIAGYIYSGPGAPATRPKVIAPVGETVIEDYNFLNLYNFSTHGPGSPMSFNDGERAWGTSDDGRNSYMHYVLSMAGPYLNWGVWAASIQQGGLYELQAWIPNSPNAGATSLLYAVDTNFSAPISQSTNRGRWVKITNPQRADSYWKLATGFHYVYVADNYASTPNESIAFDAVKLIKRS